jgi:hypothetical protein
LYVDFNFDWKLFFPTTAEEMKVVSFNNKENKYQHLVESCMKTSLCELFLTLYYIPLYLFVSLNLHQKIKLAIESRKISIRRKETHEKKQEVTQSKSFHTSFK